MEDAATAEISRTQVWQWIHNPKASMDDHRKVTADLVRALIEEEMARIARERGEARFRSGHFEEAAELFEDLVSRDHLSEFLTLEAYELLD
jgi:malate synthase